LKDVNGGHIVKMVDLVGIEPTTSSMPWKRAPSCATGPLGIATLQFSLSFAAPSNSARTFDCDIRAHSLGKFERCARL
jgi:hypothetical protein